MSLGEVSLIPATGGVFTVDILYASAQSNQEPVVGQRPPTQTTRLWDRKAEGGFPEVKTLKQLVRNIVDPDRNLGHVDRNHNGKKPGPFSDQKPSMSTEQSPKAKAEESIPQSLRTPSSTKNSKPSEDGLEQVVLLDADAAVARSAASDKNGEPEQPKEKMTGEVEHCEDRG